jgi:hypothetical protein
MGTTTIFALGFILGSLQWSVLESRYSTIFPKILKTFSNSDDLLHPEELPRLRKELGVYDARSIPMYLRHLGEEPHSRHFVTILIIVERINQCNTLFLPFARERLNEARSRPQAIAYIGKYGRPDDAKAVALLLLRPDVETGTIRQVLACLSKIGQQAELGVLASFVTKSRNENPNSKWSLEVDPCIKAIETRLEAEAKAAALKK